MKTKETSNKRKDSKPLERDMHSFMGHELKTIFSLLNIMQESESKRVKYSKKEVSKLLIKLGNTLTYLGKPNVLTKEKIEKNKKELNLADLLYDCSKVYSPILEERNIIIYSNEESKAHVHPGLTYLAFLSNLGNSLKKAPKNTSILASVKESKEFFEVSFENLFSSLEEDLEKIDKTNIGYGKGIGKRIINYCLGVQGFERENYKKPQINPREYSHKKVIGRKINEDIKSHYGFYGMKIKIPKNNLESKLNS